MFMENKGVAAGNLSWDALVFAVTARFSWKAYEDPLSVLKNPA